VLVYYYLGVTWSFGLHDALDSVYRPKRKLWISWRVGFRLSSKELSSKAEALDSM